MEISFLTIISGAVGGSILTLFGTNIVSHCKHKKHIKKTTKFLLEILNGAFTDFLNQHIIRYNQIIKNQYLEEQIISTMDSFDIKIEANLLVLFNKDDLYEICHSKNINPNIIFVIISYIEFIKEKNPNKLMARFNEDIQGIEKNFKEYLMLVNTINNFKDQAEKHAAFKKEFLLKEKRLEDVSQQYLQSINTAIKYCHHTLKEIECLKSSLSKKVKQNIS